MVSGIVAFGATPGADGLAVLENIVQRVRDIQEKDRETDIIIASRLPGQYGWGQRRAFYFLSELRSREVKFLNQNHLESDLDSCSGLTDLPELLSGPYRARNDTYPVEFAQERLLEQNGHLLVTGATSETGVYTNRNGTWERLRLVRFPFREPNDPSLVGFGCGSRRDHTGAQYLRVFRYKPSGREDSTISLRSYLVPRANPGWRTPSVWMRDAWKSWTRP